MILYLTAVSRRSGDTLAVDSALCEACEPSTPHIDDLNSRSEDFLLLSVANGTERQSSGKCDVHVAA